MFQVKEVGQRVTYELSGLSEEEIALIYLWASHTGGCSKNSPRKHSDSISRSLDDIVRANPMLTALFDQFSEGLKEAGFYF